MDKQEQAINTLFGDQGRLVYSLIYKFSEAQLLPELEQVLNLLDSDFKTNRNLFGLLIKKVSDSQRTSQISGEDVLEHEHLRVNDDHSIIIGSENPHAWVLVRLDDVESINNDIRNFKDSLLRYINKKGGQVVVAKKSKMTPQSLNRFLKSDRPARISTLLKIKDGLGLDAIYIHDPKMDGGEE